MSTEQLEQIEELARRAVTCKRWRWMPGMLSNKDLRVTRCDDDGYVVGYYENMSYIAECVPGSLPDLSDPATLGCLLAIVRERFPNATTNWAMVSGERRWTVHGVRAGAYLYPTEAAALVAALEAAP